MQEWQNRIVGHGDVPPDALVANPKNYRVHTGKQAHAIRTVLGGLGWVQRILVNRTTGLVLDGHLRLEEAILNGEATVPVDWVELSEQEETIVLASLDPLKALAAMDREKYDELRELAAARSAALAGLIAFERPEPALMPKPDDGRAGMEVDHTARFDEDEELEETERGEGDPYSTLAVRQIQFVMDAPTYDRVLTVFDEIMETQDVSTNAAAVLWLLDRYA